MGHESLRADKEIATQACKRDGFALAYAAPELQADPEVIYEAVKKNWWALTYAHHKARDDKKAIKKALEQDHRAITLASKKLQKLGIEEILGKKKAPKSKSGPKKSASS